MKYVECVKTNEQSNFRFLFFELWSFFILKSPKFSMNFHDNSKDKNQKIDFSFNSAYFASFIKTGAKLDILSWKIPLGFYT